MYVEVTTMTIPAETAQKLLDLVIEQRVENWLKELDSIAQRIGMNPEDLRRELRPFLQKYLDKYFAV